MKLYLVINRQSGGKVYGLFKKFITAKKLKTHLMKVGIVVGIDEIEIDFL